MGRLTLFFGYVITGDERLLNEYNKSFGYRPRHPYQPPPSKEWLVLVKQLNAAKPAKVGKVEE